MPSMKWRYQPTSMAGLGAVATALPQKPASASPEPVQAGTGTFLGPCCSQDQPRYSRSGSQSQAARVSVNSQRANGGPGIALGWSRARPVESVERDSGVNVVATGGLLPTQPLRAQPPFELSPNEMTLH